MTIETRNKNRIKNLGEVFTNNETIKKMYNLYDKYSKNKSLDINTKILEPSAGIDNFLIYIIKHKSYIKI